MLPILCRERSGVLSGPDDRGMAKLTAGGSQDADTSAATCGHDLVLSQYGEVGGSIGPPRALDGWRAWTWHNANPKILQDEQKINIPKAVNDLWTTWGRSEETPSTCNVTPPQIPKTSLLGGDCGASLTTDGSSSDTDGLGIVPLSLGAGEVGRPPHCPNLVVEGNATEVCGGERVRPWPWRTEVIEPSEERLAWDMSTIEERADRDRL